VLVTLLVAGWFCPVIASADEAPRPAAAPPPVAGPVIKLPVPIQTDVTYPKDTLGDASVIVELTIDTDGSVLDVTSAIGPEPFASQAREAALLWKFEPARRDGRPVKVKIRFETRFVGEHPLAPEETAPAPAATASTPSSPPPKEYSVTVRGERATPGGVSVSRAEARLLPGTFGDPFRAVESLAGVTPVVSVVPFFYMRGAPPGNIGYFVDGIRVPLLFHALVGPAVIQSALIDRIDVYKSAAPAEYGRFAGGVIAAETVPPPDSLHGEAMVRTLDAQAVASTPLGDGKVQVIAAARYAYAGLILSRFTDAVLSYWDYQLRMNYDVSKDDSVGIFAFGAYDYIGDQTAVNFAGTQFHRIDLRHDHRFGAKTKVHSAVTLGYDHSRASGGDVTDQSLQLRSELQHDLGPIGDLRAGIDGSFDHYGLNITDPTVSFRDATQLFPARTDFVGGIYLRFALHPTPWMTVTPGLRADLFHSLSSTIVGVDPRIAVEFKVSHAVSLIDDFGISHQTPNYLPNLPGAQIAGLRGGLQTAVAYSSGIKMLLPADISLTMTLFQQTFFNLSDPLGFSGTIAANVDVADIRSIGYTYGAEWELRRSLTKRLGGMLSYTLSRSVRSRQNLNSLAAFDHTHVATAALGYDLGRHWSIGGRAGFFTGVPTRTLTINGASFGGERGPPYFQLDVRLEKRWRVGEHGYLGAIAEVINATASTEIVERSCNPERCTESGVGPIVLPNVGVEGGF